MVEEEGTLPPTYLHTDIYPAGLLKHVVTLFLFFFKEPPYLFSEFGFVVDGFDGGRVE